MCACTRAFSFLMLSLTLFPSTPSPPVFPFSAHRVARVSTRRRKLHREYVPLAHIIYTLTRTHPYNTAEPSIVATRRRRRRRRVDGDSQTLNSCPLRRSPYRVPKNLCCSCYDDDRDCTVMIAYRIIVATTAQLSRVPQSSGNVGW